MGVFLEYLINARTVTLVDLIKTLKSFSLKVAERDHNSLSTKTSA
jgi:hypothetical protein